MSQIHRLCWVCGVTFQAKRRHARYCSGRCRTAAYRRRLDKSVVAGEIAQAEAATGARLKPGVADRLCDYSLTIRGYQGAVKEWPWRNGWFVAQGPTPLHQAMLARVGR